MVDVGRCWSPVDGDGFDLPRDGSYPMENLGDFRPVPSDSIYDFPNIQFLVGGFKPSEKY